MGDPADYLFLPLVIWLISGSYLQGQFPSVPFFVWIGFHRHHVRAQVIGLKVADRTNFVLMTVQLLILALFVILSIAHLGRRFAVAGFHHAVHGAADSSALAAVPRSRRTRSWDSMPSAR
jgi:4-amino-4-deoxy-L-arabinose transferase-like glycosyltransferase